jgi:hypothetical protein
MTASRCDGGSNYLRDAGCGFRMASLVEISTKEPLMDRFFKKTKMLIWKIQRGFWPRRGAEYAKNNRMIDIERLTAKNLKVEKLNSQQVRFVFCEF